MLHKGVRGRWEETLEESGQSLGQAYAYACMQMSLSFAFLVYSMRYTLPQKAQSEIKEGEGIWAYGCDWESFWWRDRRRLGKITSDGV
jgi:hypothetical protein